MPTMVDLTVKKADTVTNIIYSILSQSNGDGTFAKWRQDTGNTNPPAARPQFWFKAGEMNGGRRMTEIVYVAPFFYTNSTTGLVEISDKRVEYRNGQWKVPQGLPTAFVNEAVAQCSNLIALNTILWANQAQTSFV